MSTLTKKTTINTQNARTAKSIFHALVPETRSAHEKRAQSQITVKNNRLTITTKGTEPNWVKASQENYSKLVQYLQSLKT